MNLPRLGFASVFVVLAVLPARDPEHIPLWRAVTLAFFAYSGLSWAYLVYGPRRALLRWSVQVVSVAAVALGLYGVVSMIRVADNGGHFEGFIGLMGVLLAGHGLTALLYTLLLGRVAQQVATVGGAAS